MAEPKGIPDLTQLDPSTIPTDPDQRDAWFANLAQTTGWGQALKLRAELESGQPIKEGEVLLSAEEAQKRGQPKVRGGVRIPLAEEAGELAARVAGVPAEQIEQIKKSEREKAEREGTAYLDIGPSFEKLTGLVKGVFAMPDEEKAPLDLLPGMEARVEGKKIKAPDAPVIPKPEEVEREPSFMPRIPTPGRVLEAAKATPATARFVKEQERDIEQKQIKALDAMDWTYQFATNFGRDLSDLVVGLSHIANEVVGVSARSGGVTREAMGKELGAALGPGAIAGFAVFTNPDKLLENFSARPVMTTLNALMVLDAANALGLGKLTRPLKNKMGRIVDGLKNAADEGVETKAQAAREAGEAPVEIPVLGQVRPGRFIGDQIQRSRQRFSDSYSGRTIGGKAETARIEQIARTGEEAAGVLRDKQRAIAELGEDVDVSIGLEGPRVFPETLENQSATPQQVETLGALNVGPTNPFAFVRFVERTGKEGLVRELGESPLTRKLSDYLDRVEPLRQTRANALQRITGGERPSPQLLEQISEVAVEIDRRWEAGLPLQETIEVLTERPNVAGNPDAIALVENLVREQYLTNDTFIPLTRDINYEIPAVKTIVTPDGRGGIRINARENRSANLTSGFIRKVFEEAGIPPGEYLASEFGAATTQVQQIYANVRMTPPPKVRRAVPKSERVTGILQDISNKLNEVYADAGGGLGDKGAAVIYDQLLNNILEPSNLVRFTDLRQAALRIMKEKMLDEGFTAKEIKETRKAFLENIETSKAEIVDDFVVEKDGKVVFDRNDILDAYATLPENLQKETLSLALNETAAKATAAFQRAKTTEALLQEGSWVENSTANKGIIATPIDPIGYADAILRASLDAGRVPMVVKGNVPAMLRHIRALTQEQLYQLSQEAGARTGEIYSLAETNLMRRKLASALEEMNDAPALQPFFQKQTSRFLPMEGGEVAPGPGINVSLNPYLERAITYDLNVKGATPGGLLDTLRRVNNLFKRNAVAANLPSLVNDAMSNIYLQTLLRGNPFFFGDLIRFNAQQLSPALQILRGEKGIAKPRDFRYIENLYKYTDILESNVVTRDLAKGGVVETPLMRPFEFVNERIANLYARYSDVMNKTEHGVMKQKTAEGYFDALPEGSVDGVPYFVELPIDKTRVIRVVRKDGELYGTELMEGSRLTPKKKEILGPERKLSDDGALNTEGERLLGRHGNHEANVLFFDYGRVGNWFKGLRQMPGFSLASPFATWFAKATPLFGGLGLGLRVPLNTFLQGYRTNAPTLQALNQQQIAGLASRTAYQANAQHAALVETRSAKEALGRALAYNADDYFDGSVLPLAGGAVGFESLGSINFANPTEQFLRFGAQVLPMLTGRSRDELKEELFGREAFAQAKTKKEIAELEMMRDEFVAMFDGTRTSKLNYLLKVLGIGADRVTQLFIDADAARQQGKTFEIKPKDVMLMILGGTGARIVSALTDLDDPKEEGREGFRPGTLSKEEIQTGVFMVRALIGKSWNRVELISGGETITGKKFQSKVQKYAAGLKREMKANLIRPLEKKINGLAKQEEQARQALKRNPNDAVAARKFANASERFERFSDLKAELDAAITFEVENRKTKILDAYDKLYAREERLRRQK